MLQKDLFVLITLVPFHFTGKHIFVVVRRLDNIVEDK